MEEFLKYYYKHLRIDSRKTDTSERFLYNSTYLPLIKENEEFVSYFSLVSSPFKFNFKKFSKVFSDKKFEAHNFNFELYKALSDDNSRFGTFTVSNKDLMSKYTLYSFIDFLKVFLNQYVYSEIDLDKVYSNLEFNKVRNSPYRIPVGLSYIKTSSLAYQYLAEGKFKYPPTANYIGKHNKWILHPGGTRTGIYKLFNDESIRVIGAVDKNTPVTLSSSFKSIDDIYKEFSIEDSITAKIALSSIAGRIVPQVSFDYDGFHSSFTSIFKHIYSFFENTCIDTNFQFKHTSKNSIKKIFIKINDIKDIALVLKAIVLLPYIEKLNRKSKLPLGLEISYL